MAEATAGRLAPFTGQKYLTLETFRKSGQGVPTPVWFVEDAGVLYVGTFERTGKVKRLRRDGRARVAPSDARGRATGPWLETRARVLAATAPEAERAEGLLRRKYGPIKRLVDWWYRRGYGAPVVIAIAV